MAILAEQTLEHTRSHNHLRMANGSAGRLREEASNVTATSGQRFPQIFPKPLEKQKRAYSIIRRKPFRDKCRRQGSNLHDQ